MSEGFLSIGLLLLLGVGGFACLRWRAVSVASAELRKRILRDVAEHQRIEEALRTSEARFRAVVETARDAIVSIDGRGHILSWNRGAEVTFGLTAQEAVGQPISLILHERFFEDPLRGSQSFTVSGDSQVVVGHTVELVGLKKDKGEFPMELSFSSWRTPEGSLCFTAIIRDITERKRAEKELKNAYAELKETQRELIQSEKLTALGRFSLGVAHEVKNPLGIILGWTEFLERRWERKDADTETAFEKIKNSIDRADTILRDLLRFAQPSKPQREKFPVEEVVQEALSLLAYKISLQGIAIDTHFAPGLWFEVDKNQIQQVFLNILINTVEAMPKGGRVTVKTYPDRAITASRSGSPLGVVEISDTGEGISKENLPKIFEPFFTTKRDQKGTGLGLSISRTIVENHGGRLAVESEPGRGTTMKVLLPLA